jgi:hypothetical protein
MCLTKQLAYFARRGNLYNIFIGCLLFILGQTLVWFQLNSQFVWDWWRDRPIPAILFFSVPASFCFWYGVRMVVGEMNELWGPRLLIFGMSYLTFPLLTWYYMNESMFTPKTMICVLLSFAIVAVQLLWRT